MNLGVNKNKSDNSECTNKNIFYKNKSFYSPQKIIYRISKYILDTNTHFENKKSEKNHITDNLTFINTIGKHKINVSYEKLVRLRKGQFGEIWLVGRDREKDKCECGEKHCFFSKEVMHKNSYFSFIDDHKFINHNGTLKKINHDDLFVCKFVNVHTVENKDFFDKDKKFTEIKVLSSCMHPNIVSYIDSKKISDRNYQIIMEYSDNGDLKEMILKTKKHKIYFTEDFVMHIFVQILLAVEYLHRHNILHHDIKPANILVSKIYHVKLADFGFSQIYSQNVINNNVSHMNFGTLTHSSPELLSALPYSSNAEAWSLGVILYELLTLELPFHAHNTLEIIEKILHHDYNIKLLESRSPEIQKIIENLLIKDSSKRISVKDVFDYEIIKKNLNKYIDYCNELAYYSNDKQYNDYDKKMVSILNDHYDFIYNKN